jgi:hypothetical protein
MGLYEILVYGHLLAFTVWLGADLGVAILGSAFRDTTKPLATRLEILRLLGVVDMGPRTAWVVMAPLSVTLSDVGGYWDAPSWLIALVWVLAAGWMVVLWAGHLEGQSPRGARLRGIEFWIKVAFLAFYGLIGLASVTGYGPLPGDWLGWKALVFAAIFAAAIMIDVAGKPVGPLLGALIANGSSPQTEVPLRQAMDRARWWVWATYALLAIIAFLGNAKPF